MAELGNTKLTTADALQWQVKTLKKGKKAEKR
jgi:hypothetical protein